MPGFDGVKMKEGGMSSGEKTGGVRGGSRGGGGGSGGGLQRRRRPNVWEKVIRRKRLEEGGNAPGIGAKSKRFRR